MECRAVRVRRARSRPRVGRAARAARGAGILFAVQNRLLIVAIVVDLGRSRRLHRLGRRQGLPLSETDPRALVLSRILDVEQAERSAVPFEFVLHFAGQGQWLRPRQVDARILQFFAVEDRYRHDSAVFGLTRSPVHSSTAMARRSGAASFVFLTCPEYCAQTAAGTRIEANTGASIAPAHPGAALLLRIVLLFITEGPISELRGDIRRLPRK